MFDKQTTHYQLNSEAENTYPPPPPPQSNSLSGSHINCRACFCRYLSQFRIDFFEILQALLSTHPPATLKISWNSSEYFSS